MHSDFSQKCTAGIGKVKTCSTVIVQQHCLRFLWKRRQLYTWKPSQPHGVLEGCSQAVQHWTMEPWKSRRNNALQGTHSVCLHVLHLELFQVHCERLMDPQALRVWLLPSRPLFGFFLMSLHLFGSLDCRLGWCSLCIIMLASWVAPWIAASSESIYRDPMKAVDAPPDSDVAGTRKNQRPLGGGSSFHAVAGRSALPALLEAAEEKKRCIRSLCMLALGRVDVCTCVDVCPCECIF